MHAKRKGKAGLAAAIGAAGVLVIALVVLAVGLGAGLFGKGGSSAYVYLTEDGELMYMADLKEKTEAIRLTDELGDGYLLWPRFSSDGETVYYIDSDENLYCISAAEAKKGGRPERISRDVFFFRVLEDDRIFYWKLDSSYDMDLFIYDGKENFCLARDCSDFQFSEDEKTFYYIEQDETGYTKTLYKKAVAEDAREELLLEDFSELYSDFDADLLVYGVWEDSDSLNNLTVYSCTPGGDAVELVSNINSVASQSVSVDKGKVDFYYYIMDSEESSLYDYVADSMYDQDANIMNEDPPEFPFMYDYYPTDYRILDDFTIEYFSPIDGWYSLDVSDLLTGEFPTAYDLYMGTYEVEDAAMEIAQARYNAALENYEAWYDACDQAWNRDALREELMESSYVREAYRLYHYAGEAGADPIAVVDLNPCYVCASSPDGVSIYPKPNAEGEKVADLADLSTADDLLGLLQSGENEREWCQIVGDRESVLDLEGASSISALFVLNGEEAVIEAVKDGEPVLLSYTLDGNALTYHSTIAEGSFAEVCQASVSDKDVLYLFTDTVPDANDEIVGDFCIYQDGKLETIARDVYQTMILESGETYALTKLHGEDYTAELLKMKDGKPAAIADVSPWDLVFLKSGKLLYLRDDNLYLWDGKEERRIARNVEDVWASGSELYDIYNAY